MVLLAPACASFDAYADFEARGEHFRALVEGIGPGARVGRAPDRSVSTLPGMISAPRARTTVLMSPKGHDRLPAAQPIEYSLLLTATLCLLAFGVVMVFSASSTTSLFGDFGVTAPTT